MLETSIAWCQQYLQSLLISFHRQQVRFLYVANKEWKKLDSWLSASQLFCYLYAFITKHYSMPFEMYKIGLDPQPETCINFLLLTKISISSREFYIPMVIVLITFLFLCNYLSCLLSAPCRMCPICEHQPPLRQ